MKQIIVIVFYIFIIITVTWYVTYQSYLESNGNTESVNIPQPRTLPQRDLPLRSPSPVESEKVVENEAKRVQPEHSNTIENNNSNNDDNDLAASLKLLHSTHQQLIDEHDELKADVNYYKQILNENGIQYNEPTSKKLPIETIKAHLPEEFVSITEHWGSAKKADFIDLLAQPVDQDWAFDMENKIHDFFILHQYGANVRLENVNCKQSKCEIYGYYTDDIHFQLLSNELIIQPWFRATSTQSNSQPAEGSEKKFYTLVSF